MQFCCGKRGTREQGIVVLGIKTSLLSPNNETAVLHEFQELDAILTPIRLHRVFGAIA